jgi:hypothetical protein
MALRGNSSTTKTRFGILNFASRPSSAFSTEASVTVGALVADHDRGDALAEIGMRHADHRRIRSRRAWRRSRSRSLRVDVEATGDDEILAAADDDGHSPCRRSCEIAGDEEAVVAEFGLGFLGMRQ